VERLPVRSCTANAPLQIPGSPRYFGANTPQRATLHEHTTSHPGSRGGKLGAHRGGKAARGAGARRGNLTQRAYATIPHAARATSRRNKRST
jgi:hypothetical protein